MTHPLRVAVFAYEFPALTETFVLNQVMGLIDQGHNVTIFAERPRADGVEHDAVRRYGLREKTRYLNLPRGKFARVAAAFRNRDRHRGARLFPALKALRYGRDAASLRLLFWARCIGEHNRFDVIHCHFGPMGRLALQLRECGMISGRLVTVFHGVDVGAALQRNPGCYRELFRGGDLFLPISEYWRQKLMAHGCPADRTAVHHMGVTVPPATAFGQIRRPDSRIPVIVTVGRMVEKKGIEFGLRAVGELLHRKIPVRYVVVGDGPLRPALESLSRRLGIQDHVTFHGWQPAEVVRNLIATGDILLAPSITDRTGDQEGIPVTLMEAMALGIPVISTRHSGIPELVEDGASGILLPERDWPGIANAVSGLTGNPRMHADMALAARRRIEDRFNIDRLNAELVRRFYDLVSDEDRQGAATRRPADRPRLMSDAPV